MSTIDPQTGPLGGRPTRRWAPHDLGAPPSDVVRLASGLALKVARRPARAIEPVMGRGVVNWIFVADAGDDRLVVRLSRSDDESGVLETYRKEAWCLEKARELGLPGPRALSVGREEGRAYMVLTYIPGETGQGVPMDVLGVWKELGGYAPRIARLDVKGFGDRLVDGDTGRFEDSFHASFRDRIEHNLDRLGPHDPLVELGVYRPEHVDPIRTHFRAMLLEEWTLALTHGDLTPANTIVDGAGDVHLLDWGSAAVDAWPESVVAGARALLYLGRATPPEVGWFLDGMELPEANDADFRTRVERVMLLRAFDRVRWARARRPDRIEETAAEAHDIWHGVRLGHHEG